MTVAAPARGRGLVLLVGAGIALLAGLWGGLYRLGIVVPDGVTSADAHGVVMTLGFLGTMIAVERAVALGRLWGWGAPALSVAATIGLLTTGMATAPRAVLALAGGLLVVDYVALHRIQASLHNAAMGVGAVCWTVAGGLWTAGWDIARLVPWLAGFLVLTIAAERLELSRLVGAGRVARLLLVGAMALLFAGATVSVFVADGGVRVCGVALLALAAWLATNDAARRTVRGRGVTRFMAVGLLTGYAWLAAAGALWVVAGLQDDSPAYDAQLHALFLGFVMSMVFAHAPVIAPAVLRRPMHYRPRFYGPLALLHVSLLVRLVGGDALGSHVSWQVGGVLNEVALLAFVGSTVAALVQSRRRPVRSASPPGRRRRLVPLVAGLAVGTWLAALGVGIANSGGGDDMAVARDAHASTVAAAPASDGTTTVTVRLVDMRISPSEVVVKFGTRLTLDVRNDGSMKHDLRLATGPATRMLAPGQAQSLAVGTATRDIDGWCTVPGHRQAGMTMRIVVGTPAARDPMAAMTPAAGAGHGGADAVSPDLHAAPAPGWHPVDAVLPPLAPGRIHHVTWHIRDVTLEVAPGVTQRMWTFNGTVPGPVLHGRVGDTFVVFVVNDTPMTHSIDFHAALGPAVQTMPPIAPGGRATMTFTAHDAGAWLYHCATEPMLLHVGNGMYGAVVIDPPSLAPVARQYVLVGSELFFGPQGGTGDYAKMLADKPDAVVFNGYPNGYSSAPLAARAGERVRVWVVDAGPNRSMAFHVVGAHFTTEYLDGAYALRPGGSGAGQVLSVPPGSGGFVELSFSAPGRYPFLDHALADAAIGAMGAFSVTGS